MDCCSHSNRGNPLFALSPSGFAHQSTCGRHAPALPKHLAWRGRGDWNPSAYYVAFHLFFSCLSVVLAESSVWGFFCSIWVGSKCLSKSHVGGSKSRCPVWPPCSQRDISVHRESSISQQRHSRYLIKTEMNTLYICVNTKGVAVYIWNK